MDVAESWTPNHAFSTKEGDAKGGVEKSSPDFHFEGSPQMPDLLPSRSPQLAQERTGSLSPKHETGMSVLSPAPAIEERLEIDGVLNQCTRSSNDSPSDHEVQSGKDKEDPGGKLCLVPTGTPARNTELFLHKFWSILSSESSQVVCSST